MDPPNTDEAAAVLTQADDLYSSAGMRRMHHASAAYVDANVTAPIEEEHIPRLHSRARHRTTAVVQRVRAVRELHTESSVRPVDEA